MIDKKELKKQYKQNPPPMGVYQIINRANGKILVGSSKNLHGKSNSYALQLRTGTHMNRELQKEFTEFGEENFSFAVVDTLDPTEGAGYDYKKDLMALEELWIEKLQPFGEKGYNKKKNV